MLEVTDNGPGADIEEGQMYRENGVGLQNIQERLDSLYKNDFSFSISNSQPSGIKVFIRIPFETQEALHEN